MRLRGTLIVFLAFSACIAGAVGASALAAGRGGDPIIRQWPHWPGMVSCPEGGIPFAPAVALRRPADAERGTLPTEALLRTFLSEHREPGPERRGWRLLGASSEAAEFVHGSLGEESAEQLRFKRVDGEWVARYLFDGPCNFRVRRHGRSPIDWTLAVEHEPGPSTRTIEVVLEGGECAGGMPEAPRLEPPVFRRERGALLMTLWLRPLPPGNYTCQAVAEPPVKIRLPGRLGDIELMNGGVFPPRPAFEPAF